mmetsp:Transcript_1655/g.3103  ORF Transcript_1655/g.3103 Transcript_1655/m.3103 type:complete len:208 (+) Transcript_1655:2287-2910(+)
MELAPRFFLLTKRIPLPPAPAPKVRPPPPPAIPPLAMVPPTPIIPLATRLPLPPINRRCSSSRSLSRSFRRRSTASARRRCSSSSSVRAGGLFAPPLSFLRLPLSAATVAAAAAAARCLARSSARLSARCAAAAAARASARSDSESFARSEGSISGGVGVSLLLMRDVMVFISCANVLTSLSLFLLYLSSSCVCRCSSLVLSLVVRG